MSPVVFPDMEAVQVSKSGKGLGCRPAGTDVTGRKLSWIPISQLLDGSIREEGEVGDIIIPQWLAENLAEEGRI